MRAEEVAMKNMMVALLIGLMMVLGFSAEAFAGKRLEISLSQHRWYAYEDGRVVGSGRASGGRGYCPDIHRGCHTPTGGFRILSIGPANCRSSIYPKPHGGAPMNYCMFFSRMYAIHGSNDVPNYNASHGCVRVLPAAARWLSGWVYIGMPVSIHY